MIGTSPHYLRFARTLTLAAGLTTAAGCGAAVTPADAGVDAIVSADTVTPSDRATPVDVPVVRDGPIDDVGPRPDADPPTDTPPPPDVVVVDAGDPRCPPTQPMFGTTCAPVGLMCAYEPACTGDVRCSGTPGAPSGVWQPSCAIGPLSPPELAA